MSNQTLQFYSQFLNNPSLLANGHSIIIAYLQSSQTNRLQTLNNILCQSPPILTLIGNVYPCDIFPYLSAQQKSETRQYLITILSQLLANGTESKQFEATLGLMKKIHNEEGYEQWVTLYAKLIQGAPPRYFSQLIIKILTGADARIHKLSTNLFLFVIQTYTKYNLTIQQLLQILFHCLKTFTHLSSTDEQTLSTFYRPYESQLVTLVWSQLKTNPLCMKFGLKILTLLYGEMDLSSTETPQSRANAKLLPEFGLQICSEYIRYASDPHFNAINLQQQQFQQECQDAEMPGFQQNIVVIIYQLLQLYDILLADQQYQGNVKYIILTGILTAVPTQVQLIGWRKNTDLYVVQLQDQGQRNLRNRVANLLTTLIQQHPQSQSNIQILIEFFSTVASCTQTQTSDPFQVYLNTHLPAPLIPKLLPNLIAIQECSYFLLSSLITIVFPKDQQLHNLIAFLVNRCRTVKDVVVLITAMQVCVRNFKVASVDLVKDLIISILKQEQSVYLGSRIGVAVTMSIGLAKLCNHQQITLAQIPTNFLTNLIAHLQTAESKPDEDNTHIVLQLLIKLVEVSAQNKSQMYNIITPQFQSYTLHHYMYDGLLSNLALKLLELIPHQQTIETVLQTIQTGTIKQQKYSELVSKWVKLNLITLPPTFISKILQVYSQSLSLISPIIKNYLLSHVSSKTQPPQPIIQLLNNNVLQEWLVSMLKCNVIFNVRDRVVWSIKKIMQIQSQYELQCAIGFILYLGIYDSSELVGILKNIEGNMYNLFIDKLSKYAKLFQGQHLKTITSLFFLKLANVDQALTQITINLVQSYGELQTQEWQDEDDQGEIDEEDMISRILGGKMQNEVVEEQMLQIFGTDAWGAESVSVGLSQLKNR